MPPPAGVALLAATGEILALNPPASELIVLKSTGEKLPDCWDLLHPDDGLQLRERMAALVESRGEPYSCLQQWRRGLHTWVAVQASYSALAWGEQPQIVVTLVGLETQDRQGDRRCSDQGNLLATVLNHVDAQVFMKDRRGRYLYANASAEQPFLPGIGSIVGRTDAELIPPEAARALREVDEQVFREGGPLWREERLPLASGGERIFLSKKMLYHQPGQEDCLIGFSTDITELRQATEQLAASEEHFRLLAENSSDVVLHLANDGVVRWVSPSLTTALGWLPEEWIGELGTQFLRHGGEAEHYQANRQSLKNNGHGVIAREQVRAKDGGWHWIETHANPYINSKGVVEGIVARFHLIDEIVKAEETLRLSEQRHRRLADQMLDVVWAINLDGRFTYLSPSLKRLRGFTPEEVMAMPLEANFTPASFSVVQAGLAKAQEDLRAGRPVAFEAVLEEIRKDGGTVWTDVKATGLYNEQGEVLEIVGVTRDITVQHKLQDSLRISEERYRLLAENARDVIWTLTAEGAISYISPSIERLRGLPPEQAMAQRLDEIHPPDSLQRFDTYWRQMVGAIKAGMTPQSFRAELEYYCRDGSTIWADVMALPILNGSGQLQQVIGTSRDITERKLYEAELQLANQKLEAMATHDGLTGIWNRNRLSEEIRDGISRSERYGDNLTLILCDIDHFKHINDHYGHQAGDQVLIEFCGRIKAQLRDSDGFGRWGGEEFLIILPHGNSAAAEALAIKLRNCIAGQPFPTVGRVTASFGVAQRDAHEHELEWLQRVDQQLYAAKHGGRNQVVMAGRR
jgi:diguanylate cyclase (GGDEF)-like protein/PAS domain S-box-containing protein